MGYIVPALCQARKVGSPTQKAVLMALAAYAWDDGSNVWVAKATLAADLEMGLRTIQDAVKALIEKGLLVVVGQREMKRGFTIEYRIDLGAVEALPRTRDAKVKVVSDGCGSRTPTAEPMRETASRGAGDYTKGCGCRTQLSKEYITTNAHVREEPNFSPEFHEKLKDAVGVTGEVSSGWWTEDAVNKHAVQWLEYGLTEEQILRCARAVRAAHKTPPNGPKALNSAMKHEAEAEAMLAQRDHGIDQLTFWAALIKDPARYVAPSSIKPALARQLISSGMVAATDLRARSIAF